MTNQKLQVFWPLAAMLALFFAAVFFRPLLPIDETRYMTAAWEMWLRHDWFAPLTVNFAPYHHKPPMLFWLINASWSAFGVSRWAGLVPIIGMATACVYLTQALARKLFPGEGMKFESLPFVMTGSLPFLIYSTVMMFDVTLTVFVLLALLALVSYAENRKPVYILAMALAMGLGVLTKGPVAWLYVIFPALLAPCWTEGKQNRASWYGGCALAFLLSTIPVLMWLIPVLKASDPDFAFWLVWEQTAGRITGNMGNAHHRPVYFYLPLLPVMVLPWAFFPSFWAGAGAIKKKFNARHVGVRFIACWIVPVFVAFSLISGKQPHYLVPFLPGVVMLIGSGMNMDFKKVVKVSVAMVAVCVIGQAIVSQTIFKNYNLQPIADYVFEHEDADWAFARKYHGELTFLGKLQKPLQNVPFGEIHQWLKDNPGAMAVIRYGRLEEVAGLEIIMTMPYRGKNMGIMRAPQNVGNGGSGKI